MQARIVRWLWGIVTAPSVEALMPDVPGCERLLRSHGINAIPDQVRPGVIGDARIDGLLIGWFNEHRRAEVRHADAQREHDHRDLLAQLGVPLRGYKGPSPQRKR